MFKNRHHLGQSGLTVTVTKRADSHHMQHFHQNIYGRKFTLVTDHETLMTILGHKIGNFNVGNSTLK